MQNISSKPVLKCQISNSKKLKSIIFLGYLPPVNTLRKLKKVSIEEKSFPTELLYCPKSKLAQLGLIVDKKILFPFEYPYTSSTTKILRENFKNLYNEVSKKFSLAKKDLIIDIGSKIDILLCLHRHDLSNFGSTVLEGFYELSKILQTSTSSLGEVHVREISGPSVAGAQSNRL